MKPAFSAALAAPACCAELSASQPEIAITIDDLPVHAPYPPGVTPLEVNRQMIAALKAAHVPATAFVNAVNVKDADTMEALREWRAAGFVLGNHTWSHPHLSELTIAQFERELTKDEPVLRKLGGGSDWRWFRYPFLDEGKDEAQRDRGAAGAGEARLSRRGGDDELFGLGVHAGLGALQRQRRQGRHRRARAAVPSDRRARMLASRRETARELYGRDIPYVLLMHVSAMSAHMMPQVIRLYRDAGFRLVSLAARPSAIRPMRLHEPLACRRRRRRLEAGAGERREAADARRTIRRKLNAICA